MLWTLTLAAATAAAAAAEAEAESEAEAEDVAFTDAPTRTIAMPFKRASCCNLMLQPTTETPVKPRHQQSARSHRAATSRPSASDPSGHQHKLKLHNVQFISNQCIGRKGRSSCRVHV